MSNSALKQAALDHLAEERVAAYWLSLGEGRWLCVGTRPEIAKMSRSIHQVWEDGDGFPPATPPQAKEEE